MGQDVASRHHGDRAGIRVAFIHETLAPQLSITVDDLSVVARCRADARGLLRMDGAIPDLEEIEISVATSASAEHLATLEEVWRKRCPIYLAVVESASALILRRRARLDTYWPVEGMRSNRVMCSWVGRR